MDTKIFIKQSPVLNIGHVYEHIINNKVESACFSTGFLRGVDYDLIAETYEGIVYFSMTTKNKTLLKVFGNILEKAEISIEDTLKAVNEISCEYLSPYDCDLSLLNKEIISFHKEKWTDYNSLGFTKNIEQGGWIIKYPPILSFKKTKKAIFSFIIIAYKFKSLKPELRPLAAYVAKLLSIAQIDYFYNRTSELEACYDESNSWAKWQFEQGIDSVEYVHSLSIFKEQVLTEKQLTNIFDRNYKNILDNNFCQKLVNFLQVEKNSDYKYFSPKEMVEISGYLIGKTWFDNYCNLTNINYLLKDMIITINRS